MVTIIKKGRPISEMIRKLNELVTRRGRGLKSSKYAGALKSQMDPLDYQNKMRSEWE